MLKSDFANWGAHVDVAAPGEEVYSTFINVDGSGTALPWEGEFAYWSGTSIATPWVVGQVALIHDMNPALTPQEIASLIVNTAESLDGLNPELAGGLGGGLINVHASLDLLAQNPRPTIEPSALLGCGANP